MSGLFKTPSAEIQAFLDAPDRREFLIARSERLFDEQIAPIDLPGPDRVFDPLLRSAIRPLVGRLYDELLKKVPEVSVRA